MLISRPEARPSALAHINCDAKRFLKFGAGRT